MSFRRFAVALVLVAAAVWGGTSLQPPALVEPRGPGDFDHRGAAATLDLIAREPHSMGTPAEARVREALVGRLRALGLEPEVQEAVGLNGHGCVAAPLHNLVVRVDPPGWPPPGPKQREAILLVSHYDSRTAAVGAADDGSGTAALVEAMRALKAGPALAHPVIFLCTDGEEDGLLGAEAFVSQHRWAPEVGLVLNFESRGSEGPALLFETSEDSGRLVRAFAAVAPRPTGTSLAGAVYRRMPNDTDLSVFLEAGYPGLNFAFNRGWTHYHTLLDDRARIDRRSVAHQGRTALALVRRLAAQPGFPAAAPDPVYFNLLPGVFAVYAVGFAHLLAAYLVLAALLCAIGYLRSPAGSGAALGRALVAGMVGVAGGALIAASLAASADAWHHTVLGVGDSLRSAWYFAAMGAGGFGAVTAALVLFGPRGEAAAPATAVAALAIWTWLAALSAWVFVPGSYLFAWPPLLALVSVQRAARSAPPPAAWYDVVLRGVVPAPAAALLVSTIVLFFESLGNGRTGALATGGLSGLTTLLAVPLLELSEPTRCRRAAVAGLSLAALLMSAGALLTRPDADHPDHLWLAYGLDTREHRAVWIGQPQAPDPWSRRALGDAPVIGPLPALLVTRPEEPVAHAPARSLDLPPPAVAVLENHPGPRRTLKLRVTSPRRATRFWLALPAARLLEARLEGRPLPPPGVHRWGDTGSKKDRRRGDPTKLWTLDACGIGPAGFTLDLTVAGPESLPLQLADFAIDLPPALAQELGPVPPTVTPFDVGLCTVVSQTLSL